MVERFTTAHIATKVHCAPYFGEKISRRARNFAATSLKLRPHTVVSSTLALSPDVLLMTPAALIVTGDMDAYRVHCAFRTVNPFGPLSLDASGSGTFIASSLHRTQPIRPTRQFEKASICAALVHDQAKKSVAFWRPAISPMITQHADGRA
jgi:hypothetical protein